MRCECKGGKHYPIHNSLFQIHQERFLTGRYFARYSSMFRSETRKMVLDGDISGFAEEFFLEFLVAERRAILVGNAPFLKGAIRNGQRKLPVLGFHAHDPVRVIPAAGL